jgi:hypothetical protein
MSYGIGYLLITAYVALATAVDRCTNEMGPVEVDDFTTAPLCTEVLR